MKMILINFADDNYRKTQIINSWTGKHIAKFDRVIEYSTKDIGEEFYIKNKSILDNKRGCGLWLWKPYIIKKTLEREDIRLGDIVFYCDAGAFFIRRPTPVLKILEHKYIWVTETPLIEKQFTQRRTFEGMGLIGDKFEKTSQIQGGFLAFSKCKESVELVNEWLDCCCRRELIEANNNPDNEIPEFEAHREDQSILSLLVKSKDIKAYQDPTQYSRLPEKFRKKGRIVIVKEASQYKPFIVLHRCKTFEAGTFVRQTLCALLPRKIGKLMIKNNV